MSKPWVSGKKHRQSWCDQKKPCDFCMDAMFEGNKKKQACRNRPLGLKERRFRLGKARMVISKTSKEEVKLLNNTHEENGRKFYTMFRRGSLEVKVNDFVYLTAPRNEPLFVAEVLCIYEEESEPMVSVRWLFRIGETKLTAQKILEKESQEIKDRYIQQQKIEESIVLHDREVFISDDFDDNEVAAIEGKCYVKYLNPRDAPDILNYHSQQLKGPKTNSTPITILDDPKPEKLENSEKLEPDDTERKCLEQLGSLKKLLEMGFIQDAEFNDRRVQIIDRLTGTTISTSRAPNSTDVRLAKVEPMDVESIPEPAEWKEFSEYLSKPDHYFYRRWFTTGHYGDLVEKDMKISPYIDKLYDNYELLSEPPVDLSNLLSVSTPISSTSNSRTPSTTSITSVQNSKLSPSDSKSEVDDDSDNDFSKTQGKRKRKQRKKVRAKKPKKAKEDPVTEEEEEDGLLLVPCTRFTCKPEVDHYRKQPFYVKIHKNAMLLIDLHSHLLESVEIIGFMGGTYLEDENVLYIKEAFPCQSSEEADNTNVEVDPVSEIETGERIKNKNMQVVGWYHSHPLFQPDPSVRDIQTQKSYQSLFKDETSGVNCFIGAIAVTYDNRVPTLDSIFTWFWTRTEGEKDIPFCFSYEIIEDDDVPEELVNKMVELVIDYQTKETLVDLDMEWKVNSLDDPICLDTPGGSSSSNSVSNGGTNSSCCTIKEKMKASLLSRMPNCWTLEQKLNLFEKLIGNLSKTKRKPTKRSS